MPGVGITDAEQILGLVARHRSQVGGSDRSVCWAAILLLIGAMGSAADAVFHLLAYAMTAPDLDPTGHLPLMAYVQGPGLRFILPLIAAFFAGSVWLSVALARRRRVPRWNPWLYALAVAVGVIGGTLGTRAGIAPRVVGLAVLALIVAAQIGIGSALARDSAA